MKQACYFSLPLLLLVVQPVFSQRLGVEDLAGAGEQAVLLGNVVEVKKYSFVVAASDGPHTVQLARGVKLELRLHKPQYDAVANKLRVQLPGTESSPVRIEFPLPEELFLRVEFNHPRQMERIMSTDPKRLNNYRLSAIPFSPETEEAVITGQLVLDEDQSGYLLRTPDNHLHEIVLGHQNASLDGFNIQALDPQTTQVKVEGVKTEEGILANRATFWPIEPN